MSAQRASAPVRVARGAAAGLTIILAAAIAVRLAGRRPRPPVGGLSPQGTVPLSAAKVEPPPEGRVVDVKERVRQQEFKDGRPVVDIRGEGFSRGADGRNRLTGAVEVLNLGPAGESLSRLTADEIAYDPGSLRFTVTGRVRVVAGDLVMEGESFEYDKAAGLFGTTAGGRFRSRTISGRAPRISYREGGEEVRLAGGFTVEIAGPDGESRDFAVSGDSFAYERNARRGRIEGPASIEGADFRAAARTATLVVSTDESSLESVELEEDASILFMGKDAVKEGNGEIRADRIALSFGRAPSALAVRASGGSSLVLRPGPGKIETVRAPAAVVSYFRDNGLFTWSASGGIRAEIAEGGKVRQVLEGEEAAFDTAKVLLASGGPGKPAVAASAEARIEAPSIAMATETGDLHASGGVACVLKTGEGGRAVGFFTRGEDVSVASERLETRTGGTITLFSGGVLARQGPNTLKAGELETAGDGGRMTGGQGVTITLNEPSSGGREARTVELAGEEMAFRPDLRILTVASNVSVGLRDARLEASSVTAVIGREGEKVESLTAAGPVTVSHGRYTGRAEAASYEAATGRLTLTGKPVLSDGKGGSARGARLTFSLTDDKIFIENEGAGRATTVVRS